MRKLNIRWLGKLPYSEAYDLQLGLHKSVSNNSVNDDYLLLLEHDNVITSGRTSKEGNLLVSLDHLEEMNDEDIEVLKNTNTMPVALPSCSYFLSIPYTPARKIIDNGLPLALATDYNPGSTPSGNMNFVVSTACIKMKMTPEEAINAATLNGAYAMGLEAVCGSITKGKKANLIITKKIPSYNFLPYAFGSNHIDKVIINGNII